MQRRSRQSAKPAKTREAALDSTPHHRDFLACVRSGARPAADIEVGHLSAGLSHLGNIATRVRRTIRFDPKAEQVIGERLNQVVDGRLSPYDVATEVLDGLKQGARL